MKNNEAFLNLPVEVPDEGLPIQEAQKTDTSNSAHELYTLPDPRRILESEVTAEKLVQIQNEFDEHKKD